MSSAATPSARRRPSPSGPVTVVFGRPRFSAGHSWVPTTSPVTAPVIGNGSFGLIHQFGAGTDAIDLDAAARCGVQVANMPGVNAVPPPVPGTCPGCKSWTGTTSAIDRTPGRAAR